MKMMMIMMMKQRFAPLVLSIGAKTKMKARGASKKQLS
jgi:hypothetical protein